MKVNRRSRRSATSSSSSFYLKPGALAQLRDSRITRSHLRRPDQIFLLLTPAPPSPSAPATQIDGSPCFSPPRIYGLGGPRCPQRKKMVAAKSVFFVESNPTSPVRDSVAALDQRMDHVFGSDSNVVVAH